ncbi:MAG: DUF2975 domain-containing protein [Ruminococcaceae bacterium]|nr:DUF2975 domain-containing protein [Oscillospiraceae bacterium]
MYKKSVTHYLSKIIIDVLFYLSLLCTAAVPFVSKELFDWIGYSELNSSTVFSVIVFISGACCSYILFNLKQMYTSLLVGNPFIDKNVSHFRKMAVACIVVAAIYTIKCFFMFTYATVVIAAVFAVGCLFCLTLKDLFKQTINYKTENDLTI